MRRLVGHHLLMLSSVTAVTLNDAGEILLGQRSDNGLWSTISGVLEPGEQPADAILREVQEETGVDAVIERLAGVALHQHLYPNGDICHYVNTWFRCRAVGGTARVNDDESLAVGWFRPDALPQLGAFSVLKIETALKDETSAWYAQPGEAHPALHVDEFLI
jgi:8-oxo-dGTP diphosphatase